MSNIYYDAAEVFILQNKNDPNVLENCINYLVNDLNICRNNAEVFALQALACANRDSNIFIDIDNSTSDVIFIKNKKENKEYAIYGKVLEAFLKDYYK